KVALTRQANLLLGADVLISGDHPLPESFAQEAQKRGLADTPVVKVNSMVQRAATTANEGAAVLADVKAVAQGYPLRSAITLVDPAHVEGIAITGIPARGEAWPDSRLAQRLNLKVGDSVVVGDATLNVTAIVQHEPEIASGLLAIGTRLLINAGDIPAT